MIKQTPSWTMASRKFYIHQEVTPGPGSYSLSKSLDSPAAKIGTSARIFTGVNLETPGPGAYSPKKLLPNQPKAYMPSSARSDIANKNKVPGPGEYFQLIKSEGPAYSLRGRSKDQASENVPGPGKYDPLYSSMIEKSPSFKLGTSKRETTVVNTLGPGPSTYFPKTHNSSFIHHFGNSTRSLSQENQIPGPGSYEVKNGSSNISYSMTPRRNNLNNESTPGPGAYSTRVNFFAPNYSLARSGRLGIIDLKNTPGPGAYNTISRSTQPKISFSNAPRETIEKSKPFPGPAHYSPVLPQKNVGVSLRSRPSEKTIETAPGPGKYNPNSSYVLESAPTFGIGKSEKSFETDQERNSKKFPGPGTYGKSSTLSGPKWGFGSSPRSEFKKDEVPGPGSYNLK